MSGPKEWLEERYKEAQAGVNHLANEVDKQIDRAQAQFGEQYLRQTGAGGVAAMAQGMSDAIDSAQANAAEIAYEAGAEERDRLLQVSNFLAAFAKGKRMRPGREATLLGKSEGGLLLTPTE